jgi:hypothetical protein
MQLKLHDVPQQQWKSERMPLKLLKITIWKADNVRKFDDINDGR